MDYKELIAKLEYQAETIRNMNCTTMSAEEFEFAATAIETLLAERDAAIVFLRTISWCNGCVHFKGLEGCGIGIMEECNEGNDHYQCCGAKRENKED